MVSLYIAAASWSDSSACEFSSDSDVDSASPSRLRAGEARRLLGAGNTGVDLNGRSRLGVFDAARVADGTCRLGVLGAAFDCCSCCPCIIGRGGMYIESSLEDMSIASSA
jgi:hypothetical protein